MSYGLVIAGCLSGEKNDAGVAALVGELADATGAGVVLRARTGGRPVGTDVPSALEELRARGVRRALVATTHVADGILQRACREAVRSAAAGFDSLRLAPPLLCTGEDFGLLAEALDGAIPCVPGRVVALAGHRGEEVEAALVALERALRERGRDDVLVGAPASLAARLGAPEGRGGAREVLLGPCLMALGAHARRDVLVDLRDELEGLGIAVTPWPHSLAELPQVRALVVSHALAAAS